MIFLIRCLWLLKNLILGYGHLWYLISVVIGLVLMMILRKRFNFKIQIIISIFLFGLGIFISVYYKFIDITFVQKFVLILSSVNGGRNALFFAFPMLTIGSLVRNQQEKISRKILFKVICWLLIISTLSFNEAMYLYKAFGTDISLDLSIFGWIPAVFIFSISLIVQINIEDKYSILLRKLSTLIYIIHPLVIFILKKTNINYFLFYIIVLLVSILLSIIYLKIKCCISAYLKHS